MKQRSHQLETFEFCEQANPVVTLGRCKAPEQSSPDQEWSDFGEQERSSLAENRAAIFAHEVANALAAISFSMQFVKTELQVKRIHDPLLNQVIKSALGEIDAVGSLFHEYCRFNHSQTLNLELTDLAQLIEDVLALQSLACRAHGISVTFENKNPVAWVRLDALKIKQVITNLCKNAREAMCQGGHLKVNLYRFERQVILEVSDNGAGVPDGIDVFELFKTTKPGGRGLGLPLAREIVAAHQGTITYSSEPGRGATFKISLPSHEPALAADRHSNGT